MTEDASVRILSYEQHRMRDGDPTGFVPDRVIHRIIGMNALGIFEYEDPKLAYRFNPASMSILNIVRRLAAGAPNGDVEPDTDRLSIPIKGPAYVVIELSARLGWYFDPDYLGITLGKLDPVATRPAAELHSGLLHYNPHSQRLEKRGSPNCRIAVFSTLLFPEETGQPINFNLIDSNNTRFTIDPDIRYPGTGGDVGNGP